jgi:hypothetical protein
MFLERVFTKHIIYSYDFVRITVWYAFNSNIGLPAVAKTFDVNPTDLKKPYNRCQGLEVTAFQFV